MANRQTGPNAHQGARSRLASFLLVLLPGFMLLGLLAPAAVTIQHEGERTLVPEVFRSVRLPFKLPMIATHEATKAGASESEFSALRDFLASGTRMIARGAREALRPRLQSDGDENDIILDGGKPPEQELVDELFGASAIEGTLVADLSPVWDEKKFGRRSWLLRGDGERMDDDFVGDALTASGASVPEALAVPEPGTGSLLALGLLGLSLRRRR